MNFEITIHQEEDISNYLIVDKHIRRLGFREHYGSNYNLIGALKDGSQESLRKYNIDITYLGCHLITEITNRINNRIYQNKELNINFLNELLKGLYAVGEVHDQFFHRRSVKFDNKNNVVSTLENSGDKGLSIKEKRFITGKTKKELKEFMIWFNFVNGIKNKRTLK